MKVYEMAMERAPAIDRCLSLGEKLVEHFNIIMRNGPKDTAFLHHCDEMQNWINSVNNITLKPKSKPLSIDQWMDWFFTAGSSFEKIIDEPYEEAYQKLVVLYLSNAEKSIKNIFMNYIFKGDK